VSDHEAERLLRDCGGEVKTAIVSFHRGVDSGDARRILAASRGHLRNALHGDVNSDGANSH
jgi:N-acetylmuramic acid 6-phosphate (MurNAc-6-P) etherase